MANSASTPPRPMPRIPPPPREGAGRSQDEVIRVGDVLEGRYQIEEPIGEGGIGIVYRGVQLKLHRRVAIKVLIRERVGDELLRPRFEREAVTLAALAHPNIVSLTDYGVIRGTPFLVMELLEGQTLREVLDVEGAMPVERALSLTRQILLALGYAHSRGVVHRDLKPANIIVETMPDQPEHLKILDFGLAKLLPGSGLDGGAKLTRVGFAFGTPGYMSPEHATGGELDGRSDLYALGILLFEMLTGHKPFEGTKEQIFRAHVVERPPRLTTLAPELAAMPALQAFLDRALAKLPCDRFDSAHEMRLALEPLFPQLEVSSTNQSTGEPFEQILSRVRASVAPAAQRTSAFVSEYVAPKLRSLPPLARQGLTMVRQSCTSAYGKVGLVSRELYGRLKPRVVRAFARASSEGHELFERARQRTLRLRARGGAAPLLPAPRREPARGAASEREPTSS